MRMTGIESSAPTADVSTRARSGVAGRWVGVTVNGDLPLANGEIERYDGSESRSQ